MKHMNNSTNGTNWTGEAIPLVALLPPRLRNQHIPSYEDDYFDNKRRLLYLERRIKDLEERLVANGLGEDQQSSRSLRQRCKRLVFSVIDLLPGTGNLCRRLDKEH